MNLFEAQEFFNKMHKGKEIKYEFDNMCMRQIEIVHSDSLPHLVNHVEYHKLRVTVEGEEPLYLPIAPHRMGISFAEIKKYVGECIDCYIPPSAIEEYNKASDEEKSTLKNEIMNLSGLSEDLLTSKLNVK